MENNALSNITDVNALIYQYMHFCDECNKAYDFTCSGANAKKCEVAKNKLLLEIKRRRNYSKNE